eukprot:gnl/Trimastix_PCT/803.p2 GENE.gnl/Trimastix_PCT/803~~gnl/Trimastix_PCT/803.p2  ORF type:complete len:120 (+),score=13.21 gnl/Trimastix_PCT/803:86-445(+)
MDPTQVGQAFVQHYYNTFDTNRAQLSTLYRENSWYTSEQGAIQGTANIVQRLSQLPQVQHKYNTIDCQPSPSGGIIVFVNGQLMIAGQQNPLNFVEFFHLEQAAGSFYVTNNIFRLALA